MKAKRASSRDRLSTLEDKVERLEDGVRDAGERLDVVDGRLIELESKGDDVNIAINKAMEDLEKGDHSKRGSLYLIESPWTLLLKEEVKEASSKASTESSCDATPYTSPSSSSALSSENTQMLSVFRTESH
ncbi:hypothetical protein V6N11_066152 [Hibiscus sabdariffa]